MLLPLKDTRRFKHTIYKRGDGMSFLSEILASFLRRSGSLYCPRRLSRLVLLG